MSLSLNSVEIRCRTRLAHGRTLEIELKSCRLVVQCMDRVCHVDDRCASDV